MYGTYDASGTYWAMIARRESASHPGIVTSSAHPVSAATVTTAAKASSQRARQTEVGDDQGHGDESCHLHGEREPEAAQGPALDHDTAALGREGAKRSLRVRIGGPQQRSDLRWNRHRPAGRERLGDLVGCERPSRI